MTVATAAERNGVATSGPAEAVFPVDSYRDAAPHLRRPFTPEAVKFKVQATWPKGEPTDGIVVAYIDARLAIERLNMVCPHLWQDEYEPVAGGKGLLCKLTIDEITRRDVGEGTGKGLFSDALKRAAVKFGVGVSLYAIPQSFVSTKSGTAKSKRTKDGLTLVMTDAGEAMVRQRYRTWLNEHGIESFGEPLNHGDVAGAIGDPEDVRPPGEVDHGDFLNDEQRERVAEAIKGAGIDPGLLYASAGIEDPEVISIEQSRELRRLLDEHQAQAEAGETA